MKIQLELWQLLLIFVSVVLICTGAAMVVLGNIDCKVSPLQYAENQISKNVPYPVECRCSKSYMVPPDLYNISMVIK